MAEKAMEVYLNDHLGGAMLGSDLAKQLRDANEETPLGELMTRLAAEIEEDRQTLVKLMDDLGVSRNPVKQATGWLAEKASRVKFSGASSGERDHGLFLALESLRLGVAGKRCLWLALQGIQSDQPELAALDLDALLARAAEQERALEHERMAAGVRALSQAS